MRYTKLFNLVLGLAFLCILTAHAQCGPQGIVGVWSWIYGEKVIANPDRTLSVYEAGSLQPSDTGTWELSDASKQVYTLHWAKGPTDTLTLSSDCNLLDGYNQYNNHIIGNRTNNEGSSANLDLTGIWDCDDGGIYYLRQIGNILWWDGEQKNVNPSWANVARGTISSNTLTLDYSDVPKGNAIGYGDLILDILSNDELKAREKPGNYGGSHWVRSSKKPQQLINPPTVTGSGSTSTIPGSTTTNSGSQGWENPWDTPQGQACFERWISEAMSHLNSYNGDSQFNAKKPWSINKYGQLEGNPKYGPTSAYAPDDFRDHNYNKYWEMWDLYTAQYSTGWKDANWNGAQVPPLHDYVQNCITQSLQIA